jgi:hypothetical protein
MLTQFGGFLELVNRFQEEGRLSRSKKITEQPGDLPTLMVKVVRRMEVRFVQTYLMPQ